MSRPEIRVRLTPEGVREVVDALKRVQREGERAGASGARNVSLLGTALRELKSLLPTIGIAATGAAMIGLTRRASENAVAIGRLSEEVGGSTEELSGLALAFRQNGASAQQLEAALVRTAQHLEAMREGSAESIDLLGRLGISLEDLEGLETPRALELIAQRLARLPDGATKAALALELFGRSGARQLQALNAVGTEGLEAFIARAREAGVLIETDLARSLRTLGDAFEDTRIVLEGLATEFLSGFAPNVSAAIEEFSRALTGEGIGALRAFGELLGRVFHEVLHAFTSLGIAAGVLAAKVGVAVRSIGEAWFELARFNAQGAIEAVRRAHAQIEAIAREADAELERRRERLANPLTAPAQRPQATLPSRTGGDRRLAQARLEQLREQLQGELKVQQALRQQQAEADEAAYRAGLLSLSEYLRRKRELLAADAKAELAALRAQRQALVASEGEQLRALQAQRDAVRKLALGAALTGDGARAESASRTAGQFDIDLQQQRLRLRGQLEQLDTQIRTREIEHQRALQALDAEQIRAERELAAERRGALNTLDELEGQRHAVFMRNLEEELERVRELGVRAGQAIEETEAHVERLIRARTAQFNFEEVRRRAESALEAFDRDAEQIRRDQEAGLITQLTGENRLIELERARLTVLRQMADELERAARATGDAQLIEQAKQYSDSVQEIESSLTAATDLGTVWRRGLSEGLQSSLEGLLRNIEAVHSLEDAFRSLGDMALRVLADISAQIISRQIMGFLERLIPGLAGAAGSAAGAASTALAEGGLIEGPGSGTSDSILARVSTGEFVMRASRVAEPGALRVLEAWNAGRISLAQIRSALASRLTVPAFAAGGLVGPRPLPLAAEGRAGLTVNQAFHFALAPGQQVSRQSLQQIEAAAARGLARAHRRNN